MIRKAWLGCTVALVVAGNSALSYAQTMTGGGVLPGSSRSSSASGANRLSRTSGVSAGPELGTTSTTPGGLGSAARVDRTAGSASDNPLNVRGVDVRAGDASRQTNGQFGLGGQPGRGGIGLQGPLLGGGNQLGSSMGLNQNRRQNQRRAQYVTRIVDTAATFAGSGQRIGSIPSALASAQQSVATIEGASIEIDLDDEVVVLRGSVASESDRRVAELMTKLEPGVNQVRNELVVSAPVSPEAPPASPALPE